MLTFNSCQALSFALSSSLKSSDLPSTKQPTASSPSSHLPTRYIRLTHRSPLMCNDMPSSKSRQQQPNIPGKDLLKSMTLYGHSTVWAIKFRRNPSLHFDTSCRKADDLLGELHILYNYVLLRSITSTPTWSLVREDEQCNNNNNILLSVLSLQNMSFFAPPLLRDVSVLKKNIYCISLLRTFINTSQCTHRVVVYKIVYCWETSCLHKSKVLPLVKYHYLQNEYH